MRSSSPRWSWSLSSVLMRFTGLGLQMRGAVESRRLVQLDGVNAGGVVSVAWMVSSLLAGLAGVLLAPSSNEVSSQDVHHPDGGGHRRRRRSACSARCPIAAVAGVAHGGGRDYGPGLPADHRGVERDLGGGRSRHSPSSCSWWRCWSCPASEASTTPRTRWPRSTLHRHPPPRPAGRPRWTGSSGSCGTCCWPGSCLDVHLDPTAAGRGSSTRAWPSRSIFLSITLITGMAGQLSLAQATLAGVGAFTAAQLASHLGLCPCWLGGLVGAALAAAVAVVLAGHVAPAEGPWPGAHDPGGRPVLRQQPCSSRNRSAAGQSGSRPPALVDRAVRPLHH